MIFTVSSLPLLINTVYRKVAVNMTARGLLMYCASESSGPSSTNTATEFRHGGGNTSFIITAFLCSEFNP